jgi:hypothetical protein
MPPVNKKPKDQDLASPNEEASAPDDDQAIDRLVIIELLAVKK